MPFRICLVFLLILAACASPDAANPAENATADDPTMATVSFAIDMTEALEQGWFEPDSDVVGIRGGQAPLSWGETFPATDDDGDGIYTAALAFSAIEFPTDYKFKVDGEGNPNDGWEHGSNRTFATAEGDQAIERAFDDELAAQEATFTGDIRIHEEFASTHLIHNRTIYVYLPPGYEDAPNRTYPVLYLHDGNNMFDARSVGMEWQMDEAAEALIASGKIEPLIMVGVSNSPNRGLEYTPTERQWRFEMTRADGPNSITDGLDAYTGSYPLAMNPEMSADFRVDDGVLHMRRPDHDAFEPLEQVDEDTFFLASQNITGQFVRDDDGRVAQAIATKPPEGGDGPAYGRMLVEEVMPFISANYRVKTGADFTGLGGSSLGGLITMYLGMQYPDTFGKLLVVSPSVWWDNKVLLEMVENLPAKTEQQIWVDMGTGEGSMMVDDARSLRDRLIDKGWTLGEDLRYVEAADAPHNERAWAARAPDMLRFAFGTK